MGERGLLRAIPSFAVQYRTKGIQCLLDAIHVIAAAGVQSLHQLTFEEQRNATAWPYRGTICYFLALD
jgi:hypothetical protein